MAHAQKRQKRAITFLAIGVGITLGGFAVDCVAGGYIEGTALQRVLQSVYAPLLPELLLTKWNSWIDEGKVSAHNWPLLLSLELSYLVLVGCVYGIVLMGAISITKRLVRSEAGKPFDP